MKTSWSDRYTIVVDSDIAADECRVTLACRNEIASSQAAKRFLTSSDSTALRVPSASPVAFKVMVVRVLG